MTLPDLDHWRSGGRTFDWHGRPIFFRDDGAGDALVCVHGFPTASWDYAPLWPGLTARFRVVAPDLLGFGYSAKPARIAYRIVDQATLVEDLLAARGIDRVHVLAHDYGVSVAQELLARHEERRRAGVDRLAIRSVCLLNGGLFPETHRARPIQRLLRSPLGPLLSRMVDRRRFGRSFAALFGPDSQPGAAELDAFWELASRDRGVRLAPRLLRYMDERRVQRDRWVDAMQRTAVPLRLVNGSVDPVSGAHLAQRYAELIPHPDIVALPRIGHYPQVEAPEQVLAAVLEFIGSAGRS